MLGLGSIDHTGGDGGIVCEDARGKLMSFFSALVNGVRRSSMCRCEQMMTSQAGRCEQMMASGGNQDANTREKRQYKYVPILYLFQYYSTVDILYHKSRKIYVEQQRATILVWFHIAIPQQQQ